MLTRFRRCQAGARSAHADAWAAFVEDQSDFPVEDGWGTDGAFPEVVMHLTQPAAWTVVGHGLCKREEGIFELEARALSRALDRLGSEAAPSCFPGG